MWKGDNVMLDPHMRKRIAHSQGWINCLELGLPIILLVEEMKQIGNTSVKFSGPIYSSQPNHENVVEWLKLGRRVVFGTYAILHCIS